MGRVCCWEVGVECSVRRIFYEERDNPVLGVNIKMRDGAGY